MPRRPYYNNNSCWTHQPPPPSNFGLSSLELDVDTDMSPTCEPPRKRKRLNFNSFDSTVQLIVGKNSERFIFHKGLLSGLAPFFKAALHGNFKEASEAAIQMPQEASADVQRFRMWAYTGSILVDEETVHEVEWEVYVQLYIFAERYGLQDLQNYSIDNLVIKGLKTLNIPNRLLALIYENTSSTSPLRRLMVEWAAQKGSAENWFASVPLLTEYPHSFTVDLAMELFKLSKGKAKVREWSYLGCEFHVHPLAVIESKQETTTKTD